MRDFLSPLCLYWSVIDPKALSSHSPAAELVLAGASEWTLVWDLNKKYPQRGAEVTAGCSVSLYPPDFIVKEATVPEGRQNRTRC